jgi:hypothetical protein
MLVVDEHTRNSFIAVNKEPPRAVPREIFGLFFRVFVASLRSAVCSLNSAEFNEPTVNFISLSNGFDGPDRDLIKFASPTSRERERSSRGCQKCLSSLARLDGMFRDGE